MANVAGPNCRSSDMIFNPQGPRTLLWGEGGFPERYYKLRLFRVDTANTSWRIVFHNVQYPWVV